MRAASLFDCFERHLNNLEIISEAEELFVTKVLEDYFLNLVSDGITLGNRAEDIYTELQIEVIEMLHKRTYGFYNLDEYRNHLRLKDAS